MTIKTVQLRKKGFGKFKAVAVVGKKEELLAYGNTEIEALKAAVVFQKSMVDNLNRELDKFSTLKDTLKTLLGLEEPNETVDY